MLNLGQDLKIEKGVQSMAAKSSNGCHKVAAKLTDHNGYTTDCSMLLKSDKICRVMSTSCKAIS